MVIRVFLGLWWCCLTKLLFHLSPFQQPHKTQGQLKQLAFTKFKRPVVQGKKSSQKIAHFPHFEKHQPSTETTISKKKIHTLRRHLRKKNFFKTYFYFSSLQFYTRQGKFFFTWNGFRNVEFYHFFRNSDLILYPKNVFFPSTYLSLYTFRMFHTEWHTGLDPGGIKCTLETRPEHQISLHFSSFPPTATNPTSSSLTTPLHLCLLLTNDEAGKWDGRERRKNPHSKFETCSYFWERVCNLIKILESKWPPVWAERRPWVVFWAKKILWKWHFFQDSVIQWQPLEYWMAFLHR